MASLASPSSPNSLQLRFSNRSINSNSLIFKIQFRPSIRRVKLLFSDGRESQSRCVKIRSQDSFSGWSGADDEDGGDSRKNSRFGGMLGVGLAGVFFTAGITFASLSLSSRSTTGGKQQMQPVTTEQEMVLTSDDQIEKVDQPKNETSILLPDKDNKIDDADSDIHAGINKDFLPHIEVNEESTQSEIDNIHNSDISPIDNSKLNDDVTDTIDENSTQDIIEKSTPPTSIPNVIESSTSDGVDISNDTSNTMVSSPLDQFMEHDPAQNTSDHVDNVDLSALNTDAATHINGSQEGNLYNINIPLVSSEPSTPSLIMLEPIDITDSQGSTKEMVDVATMVSIEENSEHRDIPVPSETINISDKDHNEVLMLPKEYINSPLDNNAPSVSYSGAVLADPYSNEPDISSYSQTGKSSTFESVLNEKPISYAGIPAPSLVSTALQVSPGKVLVPAVVDQVQGQAMAALQVLKVIESDAQPGDLCTRREYACWLVSASSALSRNTISKVYPAMYIENITELAFDDITPEDPDYSCIQGLAEAGIISSKLSNSDLYGTSSQLQDCFFFSPESPVSRQDLVSWKIALEKRQLPEVDRNYLHQYSGYIDVDKIDKDAWPALAADISAGEQGITVLAFGYTRLFQPNKPVTKAQAAVALATGEAAEVVGEELTRIEAESLAENAVNAHTALVAQVEQELNASFEAELAKEREKTASLEKLAEEARIELERLKAEREEQNNVLIKGRAAVESEMEVLSRLRHEVEEQLQDLMTNKLEISFEKDRISKLRKETESENQMIVQLQYELEVERKALSLARSWAEEEAKKAREHAKALEEARNRWEKQGIRVVVDEDLKEDALIGVTWLTAGQQETLIADDTANKAENLVEILKAMAAQLKIKSSAAIERIIHMIQSFISNLKGMACKTSKQAVEIKSSFVAKASSSVEELKENASGLSSSINDRARKAVEECKEGVEKLTQKFKT